MQPRVVCYTSSTRSTHILPTPPELAYCAGIIDGDGSIGIYDYTNCSTQKLVVRVEMGCRSVLEKLESILGGWITDPTPEAIVKRGQFHTWTNQGRPVGENLRLLRPYLYGLGEHTDIALAFAETIGEHSREVTDNGDFGRLRDDVDILRVDLQEKLRALRGPVDIDLPKNGTRQKRRKWEMSTTVAEEDFAWAAGIVDSDGCITITKKTHPSGTHNFFPIISVAVENGRIVRKLNEALSGTVTARSGKANSYHRWVINGGYVGIVLRRLLPHLVGKRKQADVALQFCETMGRRGGHTPRDVFDARVALYYEIRDLNANAQQHAMRPRPEIRYPLAAGTNLVGHR